MASLLLGLGSNSGSRENNLRMAVFFLKEKFSVNKISSVYSSMSLLKDSQPDYLNMVLLGETDMLPEDILNAVKAIESRMGRRKSVKRWGERKIDIDIIDYGGLIRFDEKLTLPHPGAASRSFVLYPLKDVAPDYVHPLTGKSVDIMISELKDELNIINLGSPELLA